MTTNHVSPNPPLPSYPTVNYTASDWTNAGYTIKNYSDCSAAQTFLLDPGDSNKYVVRISPSCNLAITNKVKMQVHNDIAIISDGDINVTNKFEMDSTDGQWHTVYWIVPSSVGGACGNGRINFNNEVKVDEVHVFVYSPCDVTWTNKTAVGGQIFGKNVSVTNSFELDYYPINVPGFSSTSGYNVAIAYIREVNS